MTPDISNFDSSVAGQLQNALALIHQGRLTQADLICRQVLLKEPGNFNALQLLGHVALQKNDYGASAQWLRAAAATNPANAQVHSNLAVALLALNRAGEALESCRRALSLDAHLPEAHSNQGNALRSAGRNAEALLSYERAISFAPRLADAHFGRSLALMNLGRPAEALIGCDQALQAAPHNAAGWTHRGMILLRLKRPEDSLAAFDEALSLSPELPEALNNRGTALRLLHRPREAMASYEQALRSRPDFVAALCNMANVWLDAGSFEEAVNCCDRALQSTPGLKEALDIRGTALRALGRHGAAAESFARLAALAPDFDYVLGKLFFVRAAVCDWSDRDELGAKIVVLAGAGKRASSPHSFLSLADSPAAQLQCARTFVEDRFPAAAPLWGGERYQHERIRIAYLSADFRDHPVARLMVGVWEHHDRNRFETLGISLRRDAGSGAMRRRLQQAFEHFEEASDVSDRDLARRLRAWEADIVVDLTGHTRGGRLGVLSHRPAPAQVSHLGFAGTSGASYVDYLIADAMAMPGRGGRFFSERAARLPHSFLPNDDTQLIASETPRRRDLGLPERGFVFCAFNNPYKLNPAVFDVWMQLLRETPRSVLWLRSGEPALLANLAREAAARGVAPERLVFAQRVASLEEHLARYRQADLFLDTWPYGAHATARDALWAGLPVLTCVGDVFASRVAGSLLSALDLPELICANPGDYAARALSLADSPVSLTEIRAKLAHHRQTHPVFETNLYRQHLESAYGTMWERGKRGDAPKEFSVPAIR